MVVFERFGGTPEIQPFAHYSLYMLLTVPAAMVLLGIYGFVQPPAGAVPAADRLRVVQRSARS